MSSSILENVFREFERSRILTKENSEFSAKLRRPKLSILAFTDLVYFTLIIELLSNI